MYAKNVINERKVFDFEIIKTCFLELDAIFILTQI